MCFTLAWVAQLCVQLVILAAVVMIIRLLVPYLTSLLGIGTIVVQIINIVLWAIVCIFVIYLCFDLIECLVGAGGFHLGPQRHY